MTLLPQYVSNMAGQRSTYFILQKYNNILKINGYESISTSADCNCLCLESPDGNVTLMCIGTNQNISCEEDGVFESENRLVGRSLCWAGEVRAASTIFAMICKDVIYTCSLLPIGEDAFTRDNGGLQLHIDGKYDPNCLDGTFRYPQFHTNELRGPLGNDIFILPL